MNSSEMKILHQIFLGLPGTSEPRLVVLHLLIDKCKSHKACLETLGGVAFFMNLLADPHAPIAYPVVLSFKFMSIVVDKCRYYVAHFLMERFGAERPEDYRIILSQLLSKAVESNNEQLVSNPYFQFRAILELSSKKP